MLHGFNAPFPGVFPTTGITIERAKTYGATTNYIFQLMPPTAAAGTWTESTVHNVPRFLRWGRMRVVSVIYAENEARGRAVRDPAPEELTVPRFAKHFME